MEKRKRQRKKRHLKRTRRTHPGKRPGDDAEAAEDAAKTEKKKLFGKKNKKDKKDEKIDELTDRLTRQMAEFDNFRKRTEKEKAQMYEIGAKDIIEKILPVVDNFERGLSSVAEEEKETPFAEGMEKIYKQLMTTLESIGVKPLKQSGRNLIRISTMPSCMWRMRSSERISSLRNSRRATHTATVSCGTVW